MYLHNFVFFFMALCKTAEQRLVLHIDLSSPLSCYNDTSSITNSYQIESQCFTATEGGCTRFRLNSTYQVSDVILASKNQNSTLISLIAENGSKTQCSKNCRGPAEMVELQWSVGRFNICSLKVVVDNYNMTIREIKDLIKPVQDKHGPNIKTTLPRVTTATRTTIVVKLNPSYQDFHILYWVFPVVIVLFILLIAIKLARRLNEIKNFSSVQFSSTQQQKNEEKEILTIEREVKAQVVAKKKVLKTMQNDPENKIEINTQPTKTANDLTKTQRSGAKVVVKPKTTAAVKTGGVENKKVRKMKKKPGDPQGVKSTVKPPLKKQ